MTVHPNPKGLDRDHLHMANRDKAVQGAHSALTPMNRMQGEELVSAVSVLFAAVCNRVALDPQLCHSLGMRMLREEQHHTKANAALQSLRDFAGIQIAGERDVSIS